MISDTTGIRKAANDGSPRYEITACLLTLDFLFTTYFLNPISSSALFACLLLSIGSKTGSSFFSFPYPEQLILTDDVLNSFITRFCLRST